MRFSDDFVREVVNRTDLVQLMEERGVALRRTGSTFKACCPFHSEKTPSFNVNPQRGFFHCFGSVSYTHLRAHETPEHRGLRRVG